MPEDIRSSRYANGIRVATTVIKTPLIFNPLIRLPNSSTSAKIAGNIPSLAMAYWSLGCAIIVTSTTNGRATNSPIY
jgi:hypothetical protein